MRDPAYKRITAASSGPEALGASVRYLADHLTFLRKREKVLICFPDYSEGTTGGMMAAAVRSREAIPVLWEGERRWKTLLRLAFSSKATTVIGPPLTVLGLSKLARANKTPLFIRNVITAGYPCLDWMIDGIIRGLDCRTWGCFGPGMDSIVAGFSCGHSRGVHLRSEEYGVDIVDDNGKSLPEGELGEMVLYRLAEPEVRLPLGEMGRIVTDKCKCGSCEPRLVDMQPGRNEDPDLVDLGQHLQSWSSVLDCRLEKGPYGLEMEIVTFPGEKLPELPTCAKRILRPWDPDRDEPFPYVLSGEKC